MAKESTKSIEARLSALYSRRDRLDREIVELEDALTRRQDAESNPQKTQSEDYDRWRGDGESFLSAIE